MDGVIARAIGLGAHMNGRPDRVPDTVAELSEMLTATSDPPAMAEIIRSLGLGWSDAGCRAVLPLWRHPDAAVRLAVAQALHASEDPVLSQQVVDALVELCSDTSDDVRDWATFQLGTGLDVDGTDVRSVLAERLADPAQEVRDEAMVGLARRHDRRAVGAVRENLRQDRAGALTFEAASYLADPSLLAPLLVWSANLPEDQEILAAVEACDPAQQRHDQQRQAGLLAAVQLALDTHLPSEVAIMFCTRGSNEVLLSSESDLNRVWSVPSLLARADGDVASVARLVVDDLEAATTREKS